MSDVSYKVRGGRVHIKSNLDKIFKNLITPKTVASVGFQKELGGYVLDESTKHAEAGMSPVRTAGRYKAYAAQRLAGGDRPKSSLYPYSVMKDHKDKKVRPVNLKLTSGMMSALNSKGIIGGVSIGIAKPDTKIKKLFEAHNEGKHPFVPQRKFLPNKKGEQYILSIHKGMQRLYAERVFELIKKHKLGPGR